jgi:hypothetical protein
MPRYTALLDACVLVPIALADTLLRVAERELYRPLWSDRILAEAADAALEIHADLDPDVVAKRFTAMNDTFDDARVEGWDVFEATLTLPDSCAASGCMARKPERVVPSTQAPPSNANSHTSAERGTEPGSS